VRGILLTHGHEDHIGALSYALQAAPAPVYGSRLTLGFARRRLAERGIKADLRTLRPGEPVEIGPFRVHPIRVAHSVLDSLALAIETPAGVVLASGDFKLDQEADPASAPISRRCPRGATRRARSALRQHERRGGRPRRRREHARARVRGGAGRTRGRVLVSCFATSIPRIETVARLAGESGRPVAFLGRRMVDNADRARAGAAAAARRDADRADFAPRRLRVARARLRLGQPGRAALGAVDDQHRRAPRPLAGPGDTVVLSARAIPGNERGVSRLISNLFRLGCDVVHPGTARVHVSGHGSRDDLVELLRRTRPRYLVPVHGEYRMLAQHQRLAVQAGLPADRVLLAEDGDVLSVSASGARREGRVEAGRVLLDRGSASEIEDLVVRDRRHLSSEGIVVPIVVIGRRTGQLESPPEIVTRGIVDDDHARELADEAGRLLAGAIDGRPVEERLDAELTRERVRDELRRFFKRRTQRRPMVIPVVMEV
jgi:ribonuclease J